MTDVKAPKKLIEVSLPLDEINAASVREKSIRHGHPSTLHLWWARRPLATARAVLFAQLVNDPGYERNLGRGMNKEKAEAERKRLFGIMKKLVLWENTNNEEVLAEARAEIQKSWQETCALNKNHPQAKELFNPEKLPAFHDPFAGGGAIPLEAQRLGLEAWASDLNPVAVLINKAMIEIPPKFAGMPPVNPESRKQKHMGSGWRGAEGLAEDVRHYGQWMRDEAEKRIGNLYPKVMITKEMAEERPDLKKYVGEELTVIAWLWSRTVRSPNPAFKDVEVPLVRSFLLSARGGGKNTWVDPVDREDGTGFDYVVRVDGEPTIEGTIGRKGGVCIMSGAPMDLKYVRAEGKAGRMRGRLMAIVAEGHRERVYLSPTEEMARVAAEAKPEWRPEVEMPLKHRNFQPPVYGMVKLGDIFTPRQLVALNTFSDLMEGARNRAYNDGLSVGIVGDRASTYADSVSIYLAFIIDKMADLGNSLVAWEPIAQCPRHLFGRQAVPMVWDFAEANPFSASSGSWEVLLDGGVRAFSETFRSASNREGISLQADASNQEYSRLKIISIDPPYFDNIGYADLSDFFYVWLRRSLKSFFPSLFTTMSTPKSEELIAAPHRHGSIKKADEFFMEGMTKAMCRLVEQSHVAFPVTIYYAFKQSDTKAGNTVSNGWESFLEAVMNAGFVINGTWPMRTENNSRLVGQDKNALASSIVLVCRRRVPGSPTSSRKEFLRELRAALPEALDEMTTGSIAPVDLAQAAIGPGMGIFSRYSEVLEADGARMSVHDALVLINRELDAYFSGASGDLEADSRFCLGWFEQMGWKEGVFGEADVLARARGTTVDGVKEAGILEAGGGRVRLLRWNEYPEIWTPEGDSRTPVWEALHHLLRVHQAGGDSEAGALLARMSDRMMAIRQLAYRLYTLCERKGWAEDARPYNELIASWGAVEEATPAVIEKRPQKRLDSYGDKNDAQTLA